MIAIRKGDIVAVAVNGRTKRAGTVDEVRDDGKVVVLVGDHPVVRHHRFVEAPMLEGEVLRVDDDIIWEPTTPTAFEHARVLNLKFNDDGEWWVQTLGRNGSAWNDLERLVEASVRRN